MIPHEYNRIVVHAAFCFKGGCHFLLPLYVPAHIIPSDRQFDCKEDY